MNSKEIATVLTAGQYVFPSYFSKLTPEEITGLCDTWAIFFADDDPVIFTKAFHACALTNTFFPSIAEMKQQIARLTVPDLPNEQEAWAKVREVMSFGYSNTEKAWIELTPEMQRAVGSKRMLREWSMADIGHVNTVIASNFMRTYREIVRKHDELKVLPDGMRNEIIGLSAAPIGIESPKEQK